jgi:hypothetical protein
MPNNFDFSQYDGELENECTLLTRKILDTRRRIQKTLDCNEYRLASRTILLDAVNHLNLLLKDIFDTYDEFTNE